MLQRLENYIKNLMEALATEYPTVKFYAWDVVNEAVDPNTSDGMRTPGSNNKNPGSSLWMQTVGRDFIVKAFEYARKYAPADCKLFYNDYNEYEDRKCDFIIEILTGAAHEWTQCQTLSTISPVQLFHTEYYCFFPKLSSKPPCIQKPPPHWPRLFQWFQAL